MTYIIPNQTTKKIVQTNENDLSGNIYVTKNIDLRNDGYIKLSHFPFASMTEDDDADFTPVDTILKGANEIFLNARNVFSGLGGFKTFTDRIGDTNAPTPGVEDDAVYFNGTEVISDGNSIYYRSGANAWTVLGLSLSSPCQMAVFDVSNSLLIGYSNIVKMINTSWTLFKTLTIPSVYEITAIETNGSTIYIGTRHKANGEAKLFLWDGSSSAWNSAYGVDAGEISSIRKYGATCVLFTSKGQLLQFNGSSFNSLANFPLFYDKANLHMGSSSNDHDNVSNRGLYVDGDIIYINIHNLADESSKPFSPLNPSGVWVYTPTTGLSCLTTPTYNRITKKDISTGNVNITTNVITTTNVPMTGTPAIYDQFSSPAIGGLKNYKPYYVIKLSDTTLKLASSLSDAIAGIEVDLTTTGNAFQSLYFFSIYDYGHTYIKDRSAVCILTSSLNTNSLHSGSLMYTNDLYLPDKAVLNQLNPLLPNRGYFITPKLNSSNTEDLYNEITIKHRPLNTDEKIVIKYKTIDKLGLPFSSFPDENTAIVGTWTDTDTFTTTLDMSLAEVGDEIEIVAGKGAGMLFHIASLSVNAGTWTVNLDETFPYAVNTETMHFAVNNFKKLGEITKETSEGIDHKSVSLNKNSKFLQLKIELRGVDVTIEELQVSNKKFE